MIDDNGVVSYTPDSGYTGDDTISVSVTDNDGFTVKKDIDVTVLSASENADNPTLTMSIANETSIDTQKVLENDFDTSLGHWRDENYENSVVTLDNSQMRIDGDGDYAINVVDYCFGAAYAGRTVTVSFNTDVEASQWDASDEMKVYVDSGDGNGYRVVYSEKGEEALDNGALQSFDATLDENGRLNVAILNNSSNDNEDLWVDNFTVSLPVTEYRYQIDMTPTLTDTDGSETLQNLILKDLPASVSRVEDSEGNLLTPNHDGTYTIAVSPESGVNNTVYIYSDTRLDSTTIDEIHSQVTAVESSSGDIATVEVDASNHAVVIDGIVEGMYYETSSGLCGYTDADGNFDYADGDTVIFKIGNVEIGQIDTTQIEDGKVFLQDIAGVDRSDMNDEYVENMAVLLQSLDADGNADNGIVITQQMHAAFSDDHFDLSHINEDDLNAILHSNGIESISEDMAMDHVAEMLIKYDGVEENGLEAHVSDDMDGLICQGGFDFSGLAEIDTNNHDLHLEADLNLNAKDLLDLFGNDGGVGDIPGDPGDGDNGSGDNNSGCWNPCDQSVKIHTETHIGFDNDDHLFPHIDHTTEGSVI